MKKIMIAFVTGVALFVLGLGVLFGGIIGLKSQKTENTQERNLAKMVYECQNNNISSISTALISEDVKVQVCDVNKITISYYDDPTKPLYKIKESGKELKISRGNQINGSITYNFSIVDFSDLISAKDDLEEDAFPVEIAVPRSYVGEYNLNSISGDVYVEGTDTNGDIDVATISGNISLKSCEVQESVSVDTTSGNVDFESVHVKENVDCNTISGMIDGMDVQADDFQIDTTSGEIEFEKTGVGHEFSASSLSGSVNLTLLDSIDNYDLSVDTLSGFCNVPREYDRDMGKSIDISTTSGNVTINSETE